MLKKITLVLMLLSSISCYRAQTTLVPGDILFTSFNGIPAAGVAPDTFSFVILTPITTNTLIYFTERGFQGGGVWQASGTTEGTISWTSGSALAIGQEVVIAGIGAGAATVNGVPNGNVAIVSGGNVTTGLSLAPAADQVIAFQGAGGDPTLGSAVMISGISWHLNCGTTSDATWNGAGCAYGPQSSAMPPGLTGGTNAFLAGVAMASPNNSHGFFNCAGTPYSTVPALKAALMNKANWTMSTSSVTVLNIPGGCNYYATCSNPTINTQPTNSNICLNGNTSFSIVASGATSYQWQVNTGSGFSNITNGGVYSNATTATLTITGATAVMNGYLYRCIAMDGACSTTSNQATLTVSNPSLTPLSQTNVACNGGSTGAASVNAGTGGVAPYTYNWTPGNPIGDGTTSVSGLIAGTWTCTVTDNIGCTASTNFTITQPTALALTAASQTNVSCNGGSNGAATVNTATGGAGGYTYNWTPGNPVGDGTVSVSGLIAGTWTCTVTDANACTTTRNFTITQPTALVLTAASQTNVACNGGSNGAATVNTATGGAGGYTYNWTPGNPTGDGTVSVTGLTAGTWTCTVTDANACTAFTNFTITQPTALALTAASQTNVSCNGGSNGAATVNIATGGAGGYTYNWTPGNPVGDGTVSVTGLTAGTWTCTVMDANACTTTRNFTITQPTALVLTAASQTNVSCNGGSNGAASVNPATGGAGGYTYNWTPGNPTGDGTVSVSGLTAGTWTCTVTDANSCTSATNFTITQPTALVLTAASQTNVSCNGGSNGAASVNPATGGAGGYTYNWTPGNPVGDGTVSVTGLTAGTWTCTVTDANSCTTFTNFTITQPVALSANISSTNTSCTANTGTATVSAVAGGAGGYTYDWTPGNPTGDGSATITGLAAGTYTCTITDANGCQITRNTTIISPSAPTLTPASQTNVSCNSGSNGAATVNPATGGTAPYTYNWTPGNPTGDGTVSVTGLTAGTWTCTVSDASGCTSAVNFTITQPSALNLTTSSQTNVSCNSGSNGAATVNVATGGAGGYTYNWTPGNPTGDGTTSVSGLTAGTWTCTVTDANACTASTNFTVTQPTALVLTAASQTNVSCNGGSNGAASVNVATGGAGGYTYDWTPGNPTGDGTVSVTGLTAGTWTCIVTDANGCTASTIFTITQPTALVLSAASQTNVTCNGGSNGTASVNSAIGGSGSYTYDWSPGNPTGDGTTSVTGLTSGTWTCTTTDANGCTSLVNFTITQPTVISSNQSVSICSGDTLSFNGNNYTTPGTYTDTLSSVSGCDSLVITTLTFNTNPTINSLTALDNTLCLGESTQINVVASIPTSTYCIPVTSCAFPDVITNVSFGTISNNSGLTCSGSGGYIAYPPSITTTLTAGVATPLVVTTGGDAEGAAVWIDYNQNGIFENSEMILNGFAGTNPATYSSSIIAPLTAYNGQTKMRVRCVYYQNPASIGPCAGTSYGETEDYTITIVGGVDMFTYNWTPSVFLNNTNTSSVDVVNPINTTNYTVEVTYTTTGCSNTSSVNIVVNSLPIVNLGPDSTTCGSLITLDADNIGSTFVWNDASTNQQLNASTSGEYFVDVTDLNGCSNSDTIQLVFNSPTFASETITECDSYTWSVNGQTYTTSGTYTGTLMNSVGCDSIITLNLTINNGSSSTISATACDSYLWSENGQQYTTSGVYSVTYSSSNGCDSIINLDLTIFNSTTQTNTVVECESFTWPQTGITYTSSGVYTDTLISVNGCDSIFVLDLTISGFPVATATNNGNATISASTGTTYQWIDCASNLPISGATTQMFTPSVNGNYAVIVTNASGCSDTSSCVLIDNVGIYGNTNLNLSVIPNPTKGIVKLTFDASSARIIIRDAQGKLIQMAIVNSGDEIDLSAYQAGLYFFEINTQTGNSIERIIKE